MHLAFLRTWCDWPGLSSHPLYNSTEIPSWSATALPFLKSIAYAGISCQTRNLSDFQRKLCYALNIKKLN